MRPPYSLASGSLFPAFCIIFIRLSSLRIIFIILTPVTSSLSFFVLSVFTYFYTFRSHLGSYFLLKNAHTTSRRNSAITTFTPSQLSPVAIATTTKRPPNTVIIPSPINIRMIKFIPHRLSPPIGFPKFTPFFSDFTTTIAIRPRR